MKCSIFTTALILAASTASALYVPRDEVRRAASSVPDPTNAATPTIAALPEHKQQDDDIPSIQQQQQNPADTITEDDFGRLYSFVEKLVQSDDYAQLTALNYLTEEALGLFESSGGKQGQRLGGTGPSVLSKRAFGNVNQTFKNFRNFIGGRPKKA